MKRRARRPLKRLRERYDNSPEAWAQRFRSVAWLAYVDQVRAASGRPGRLHAGSLRAFFRDAGEARAHYEADLEARGGRRRDRAPRLNAEGQRVRRLLAEFDAFARRERGAYFDAGFVDDVSRRTRAYARRYQLDNRAAAPLKKGAPGDAPWLMPYALGLARALRQARVPERRIRGFVLDGFALTGHQDRVSFDKLRHIFRAERPARKSRAR